ncbi:MAG: aspartate kinase, monofunctional class [Candidatus Eisenbacteria bacterium RBG_16_71_46]|nr:MAG: aspartate kinase, monofunctional class [Candidatus Eisenbacteria bacterium RBG_16_71_46]
MKLVMKFGGSSLADADRMRHCAALVRSRVAKHQVAVVVSAMDGVTEELLALADAAAAGTRAVAEAHLAALRRGHEEAAAALGEPGRVRELLDELDRLAGGIAAVGELTPRSRDAVLAFGERLATALFHRALTSAGVKARAFDGGEAGLVTDDRFGDAEPLVELSLYQVAETLGPLIAAGEVPVITGFIAATQHGVTTTLGRGGSDYTATLVGAALGADEIWIWSDVDGLMSADPRIVPGARRLERISFSEAVEMAQFGAKAMHPRALEPAAERGVPVRIRNTFRPEGEGTLIAREGDAPDGIVRSVHVVHDSGMILVTGAGMIGRVGTAARVFEALGEHGINIRMISQSASEAAISIAVGAGQLEAARAALEARLLRTGHARRVLVEPEVAIVAAVGAGMRGTRGVAARVFGAVAARGINVIAIAQGSSELSISFAVGRDAGPDAARALHDEFGLAKG